MYQDTSPPPLDRRLSGNEKTALLRSTVFFVTFDPRPGVIAPSWRADLFLDILPHFSASLRVPPRALGPGETCFWPTERALHQHGTFETLSLSSQAPRGCFSIPSRVRLRLCVCVFRVKTTTAVVRLTVGTSLWRTHSSVITGVQVK